jgi:hypothetical protein
MPARTYPACRGGPSTERPTPNLAVGKRVAADPDQGHVKISNGRDDDVVWNVDGQSL